MRDDDLGHQRHVDDHPVALLHAARLQCVREPAHLGMQLAIAQAASSARLAFEDQGRLVTALGELHVEAVPGDVQPCRR